MIKFFFILLVSCASFETEKILVSEKIEFSPIQISSSKGLGQTKLEEISYSFEEFKFSYPFKEELESELKNFWRNEKFREQKKSSISIQTKITELENEFLVTQILKNKKNKIFYEAYFKLSLVENKPVQFFFYQTKKNLTPINEKTNSSIYLENLTKKSEVISILEKSVYVEVDFFSDEPETEISIDKKKIGKTPIFNHRIPKGIHFISIKRKGENEYSKQIYFLDEKTILDFGKEPNSILEILSFPKNEKVILNGEKTFLTNHIELGLKTGKNRFEFFRQNEKIFEFDLDPKQKDIQKFLLILEEKNLLQIGLENFQYSKEPLSYDERLILGKNIQIFETENILPINQKLKIDLFSTIETNSNEIQITIFNDKNYLGIKFENRKISVFKNGKIYKQIGIKNNEIDLSLGIKIYKSKIFFDLSETEIFESEFSQTELFKVQFKSNSNDEPYSKVFKKFQIKSI